MTRRTELHQVAGVDERLAATLPAKAAHAARPAGPTGPTPVLFPCADHGWERWDGTTWTTLGLPVTLASLTDVNLTGLTDGDRLKWDAATSKWVRVAPSTPVLLLATGASVPAGTAVGTLIFRKA